MKKNSYIRIRLTEKEKAIAQDLADARGVSVSFLIRDLLYIEYLKELGKGLNNGR